MEWLKFNNGTYATDWGKKKPSKLLPSLRFYPKMLSIVFKASRKAKRGLYNNTEWCKSSLATVRALESVGIGLEVTGIDHFTGFPGPAVFVSNHMSTLETFVLPVIIQPHKDITYIVKDSLVGYPVFRHIMRSRNPIVVSRTNAREDLKRVIEGGAERLQAGVSLIIFPQTTRVVRFDPAEFNTLGIKLARRTNVPVVPVALQTDAWGNGKYVKDFGKITPKKVRIAFAEPLWVKERGNEEHQKIIDFISQKLAEWEAQG